MDSNHYTGSAAEYAVAAFLISMGRQVWWPSVQQDSIDLLASRADGTFERLQVKKASWNSRTSANNTYLQIELRSSVSHTVRRKYSADAFDTVAAVSDDGRIWMIPLEQVLGETVITLEKRGPAHRRKRSPHTPDAWRVR